MNQPFALANLQSILAQKRGAVVRGLVLISIWGAALFGYASLGEHALQQRLPPLQASLETYAASVANLINQRLGFLEPLAADPRLPQGLADPENTESLEVRRSLYEFGYLNRISNLYVWDETSNNVARLASSNPLPTGVVAWLKSLSDAPSGLRLFEAEPAPSLYAALHLSTQPTTHAYVISPLGLNSLIESIPPLTNAQQLAGARPALLTASQQGVVWMLTRTPRPQAARADWLSPSRLAKPNVQSYRGETWVIVPIPNQQGWAVGLPLPPSVTLGTSHYAQMGVLAGALLATLLVLWKPTRPLRRKVVQKLAPMMGAITPLVAPMVGSLAAVVSGQAQPSQPIRVDLSAPQKPSAPEPARRGRMINTGGPSKPRPPKPANATYVPALKSSLAATDDDTPAPPPTPDDPLALMVDECFTKGRTQLLYQPIYNTRTGAPVMHEVLLRLLDNDGQPITPATFIPICQKYGWMQRLDEHVAHKVITLNFAGGSVPPTPLAINLAGDTMESIAYLEKLISPDHADVGKNLVFEIRSRELMEDPEALKFLDACRELGIKRSVDYFGGGSAMVESSKAMGFDYIKMDCTRFGGDTMAKKELITLCRTASRLNLPVVLEKIETVDMEVYARRIGVHFMQGYLLGKPKTDIQTGPLPGWRDMSKNMEAEQPANQPTETPPPEDARPPDDPDSPSK